MNTPHIVRLALLAALALVGTEAYAQAPQLTRVVTPDGHNGVKLSAGGHHLTFDTDYGGVLRFWQLGDGNEPSILNPYLGGGQAQIDTGKLINQIGPDGLQPFPIARQTAPASDAKYVYWFRETSYEVVGDTATYEVTGFPPFAWNSTGPADDIRLGGSWYTPYTCNSWPELCTRDTTGAAVWFDSKPGAESGWLMMADNRKPVSLALGKRLQTIGDGRVAFRVRVDMSEHVGYGIAKIGFRRAISTNATSEFDAQASSGYSLNINHSGIMQLERIDANGATFPWNQGLAVIPQAVGVSSPGGVTVEVQTANQTPGLLRVLVNDVLVHEYVDPNPLLGDHFGIGAFTGAGGKLKFSHRQVSNVGIEMRVRYEGKSNGEIISEVEIGKAPGVTGTQHQFYTAGTPTFVFNRAEDADLSTMMAIKSCGGPSTMFVTQTANDCSWDTCDQVGGCPSNPLITDGSMTAPMLWADTHSVWLGDPGPNSPNARGLWMTPLETTTNSSPASGGYAFMFASPGILSAALTPQEWTHACTPQTLSRYKVRARWTRTTDATPGVDDTCNGIDEDCDGNTDDDYVPTQIACGSNGCENVGSRTCVNGAVVDSCTPLPGTADTTCDGVDDDCDGEIDEHWTGQTITCSGGCLSSAVERCVNGTVVNDCEAGIDNDVTCDGFDDDCDGATDEDAECCSNEECADGDLCTTNACVNGLCVADAINDGTTCDDGNACTADDACADGACTGDARFCGDADPCTDDSCEPTIGCVFTPREVCCVSAADCDDGDPCTSDFCNPDLGCQNVTTGSGDCSGGGDTSDGDTVEGGGSSGGCECNGSGDARATLLGLLGLGLWWRVRRVTAER